MSFPFVQIVLFFLFCFLAAYGLATNAPDCGFRNLFSFFFKYIFWYIQQVKSERGKQRQSIDIPGAPSSINRFFIFIFIFWFSYSLARSGCCSVFVPIRLFLSFLFIYFLIFLGPRLMRETIRSISLSLFSSIIIDNGWSNSLMKIFSYSCGERHGKMAGGKKSNKKRHSTKKEIGSKSIDRLRNSKRIVIVLGIFFLYCTQSNLNLLVSIVII